jgi:predicted dehydrogenase
MGMLKAVLVGTGAIAREHLAALKELPGVRIEGVCDISAARAEATAERFGVARWYTHHQRMLEETSPDLVHVTTPPTSHFAIARDCLKAGRNVLCEKPITVEYAEFCELRELATRSGLMLLENQNLRFHSSVLRIRTLLDSGELGELADVQVRVDLDIGAPGSRFADPNAPHPCLGMRGGAIADFLTHIAYLAYLVAGPPVRARSAWTRRRSGATLPFDEFRALMECERSMAAVGFSANAQPSGFWLRVAGTKAQVEANLWEAPRLTIRRRRGGIPPLMTLLDGLAESRDILRSATVGFWRKLGGASGYDGLATLISRAYAALRDDAPPPVSLVEVDDVARMVAGFTDPERML